MGNSNKNVGILALLQAKPGKENDLHQLLIGARGLAASEQFTTTWYAFRAGPQTFGIFDTFADDEGRTLHLQGKIAAALMGRADELLASQPDIKKVDVVAVK